MQPFISKFAFQNLAVHGSFIKLDESTKKAPIHRSFIKFNE